MSEIIHNDFIMLPTIDFCFKELMCNSKVRLGFIAAVLGVDPASIRSTALVPTELPRESPDDKLGILDVMVELDDGSKLNMEMQVPYFEYWTNRVLFYECKIYISQIKKGESYESLRRCVHVSILDFIHFPNDNRCYRKIALCDVDTGEQYTDLLELHILELKKLPAEDQNEEGVIRWMRFLSGKTRKEFEDMAKKDEYIEEAYNELKKLSLDEQKRMEYEARERALHDYTTQMESAERRGVEIGKQEGIKLGKQEGVEIGKQEGRTETLAHLIHDNLQKGLDLDTIAAFLGIDKESAAELAGTTESK